MDICIYYPIPRACMVTVFASKFLVFTFLLSFSFALIGLECIDIEVLMLEWRYLLLQLCSLFWMSAVSFNYQPFCNSPSLCGPNKKFFWYLKKYISCNQITFFFSSLNKAQSQHYRWFYLFTWLTSLLLLLHADNTLSLCTSMVPS